MAEEIDFKIKCYFYKYRYLLTVTVNGQNKVILFDRLTPVG